MDNTSNTKTSRGRKGKTDKIPQAPASGTSRQLRTRVGKRLFADILGNRLYSDFPACLWEIVRNGLTAGMKSDRTWNAAEAATVEIWLEEDAAGTPTLLILDNGRGFTEEDIVRYCTVGRDDDGSPRYGGASQMQIGRFAGLALNRLTHSKEDSPDEAIEDAQSAGHGFTVFTRTTTTGPVRAIEVTSRRLSEDTLEEHTLSSQDARLPRRCTAAHGSFSAVVIPNPVFTDPTEICQALEWRLPRSHNKKVPVYVQGVQLIAPKLASKVHAVGQVELYMDRLEKMSNDGGIWLTDLASGLRVVRLDDVRHIPYPLGRRDLTGDLFCEGLLSQQDTSRKGLRSGFLQSNAWRNLHSIFSLHFAGFAQSVLGRNDLMRSRDPNTRFLLNLCNATTQLYGAAQAVGQGIEGASEGGGPKPDGGKPSGRPGSNAGGGTGSSGGGGGGGKPSKGPTSGSERTGTRQLAMRFRDRSFSFISGIIDDPFLYAEVSGQGDVICIYPNYSPIKNMERIERDHHCLMLILMEVGRVLFDGDIVEIKRFVSEESQKLSNAEALKEA